MQPLQICIGPIIRIGRESWCLPYAGFFLYMKKTGVIFSWISARVTTEYYVIIFHINLMHCYIPKLFYFVLYSKADVLAMILCFPLIFLKKQLKCTCVKYSLDEILLQPFNNFA